MKKILLLLIINISYANIEYEDSSIKKRWVEINWEKVSGAQKYEIKLYKIENKEKRLFREYVKSDPEWTDELVPGKYYLKMRGIDSRGVAAKWGSEIPIDVALPDPILISPYENDEIFAIELEEEEVEFKWKSIPGSSQYALQVWSEDLKDYYELIYTEKNSATLNLKTSYEYFWKVTPLVQKNTPVAKEKEGRSLLLIGGKLNPPSVTGENKVQLKWNKPNYTEDFTLKLAKLNNNKKWVNERVSKKSKKQELSIEDLDEGSKYRVSIKANSKNRDSSPFTFAEFEKRDGKIGSLFLKEQLSSDMMADKKFYYVAGTDFFSLDYSGVNLENDSKISTTLNGLKIFGEAYYQKNFSKLKYRLLVDYQALKNSDESISLYETSFLVGRRLNYMNFPIELYGGLFMKSDLFILGKYFEDDVRFESVTTSGPVLKASSWYRFDRRNDVGVRLKLKNHTFTLKTPNGEDIEKSFSYGLESYYRYRISHELALDLNLGVFKNNIKYKATEGTSSLAPTGSINDAKSIGKWAGIKVHSPF